MPFGRAYSSCTDTVIRCILSSAEALHMGIRDSRLQIVPGGDGPIFGATDAGVTRYALAFLEGDHSFTRLESRTGSFTSGTSMERVSTRWPEDRGYIESVRHRECAGPVRGDSRKRLSIALRSYDRDCLPERSGREAAQERRRSTSCAGCDPPGIRGSGGIGRRAGLRIQWGNPSGFESRLSHVMVFSMTLAPRTALAPLPMPT